MKLPRWLGNEPIDKYEPRSAGFEVDTTRRNTRRRGATSGAREREFSITLSVGGVNSISIPWDGTSYEDARDSFFEYLSNHAEFGLAATEPQRYFRSVNANFNGKFVLFTFRTSWITGFTIS